MYSHIKAEDRIFDVMSHPAFSGYGRLIFPWDDKSRYDSRMTMRDAPELHLWHTNMNVREMVDGVNRTIDDVNDGKQVFYDIYTDAEKKVSPAGCFFVMAFNRFSFVRPAGAAALSSVPRSLKSRADRQERRTVRRVRFVRRNAG